MPKYLFLILLFSNFSFSQTLWISNKYGYSVEIPKGFNTAIAIGANVDFKAVKEGSSIVIVVRKLPEEARKMTIWDIFGDLDDYAVEWETEAQENLPNAKAIKYGKTKIQNLDSFWMDYTTDNGIYYYKNYSFKKGNLFFVITFSSPSRDWNYYSPYWFRFKEQIKI
jgi:hypothetical protein